MTSFHSDIPARRSRRLVLFIGLSIGNGKTEFAGMADAGGVWVPETRRRSFRSRWVLTVGFDLLRR
jgi:hypothetical protein